ncbi:MAG: hypothetical protein ACYC56_00935 [Candidatus Aquicultor sp.]
MVIEPLKSGYGDAVVVNYFDISSDEIHPDIKRLVESQRLPYPLTFLNGEAISAGYISYYDIVQRIDKLFKEERQA